MPEPTHSDAATTLSRPRGVPSARKPRSGGQRIPASKVQSILAFLLFFAMGLAIMWPAPIHAGSSLFGLPGADLTGDIFYYRSLAQQHLPPFLPGTVHAFNAPEGRPVQWALNFSSLPSSLLLWLGSVAVGAIATFSYWPVFTFALSGLSMFIFARWLTGRWEAGLVAGLAWGFSPFVFSGQNSPLGDVFVIVIFVWRMFAAIERPTPRNGVWVGLSFLLAATWMEYYILIAGVAWALLAIYALVIARSRQELRRGLSCQAIGAVPIVLGLVAILIAGVAGGFAGAPVRPFSDLVRYSARPAMYVLPDPNNPFTGSLSRGFLFHHYSGNHPVSYTNAYVGISVIVLALVGLVLLVRTARRRGLRGALEDRRILVALPLTVLIAVAFLFSMPPHVDVFGLQVPMPMDAVFKFTQAFRAVARFGILVELGLCVLMALAISELVPRLRRTPVRLVAVAGLALIVTGDLWARADTPITRVQIPSIYHVLARQPKGIYAEFPILPGADYGGITYQGFYQGWAHRDTFDGFYAGEAEEPAKMALNDLLDPSTERTLASDGVKYLIVDAAPLGETPTPYPRQGQRLPGARLIARDTWGSLYRVTAKPPTYSVALGQGFSPREGSGSGVWQWATLSPSVLQVATRLNHPVRVRVRFRARAFGPARRVRVIDSAGRFVYTGLITSTSGVISFTATIDHQASFSITSNPGPIPIQKLDPSNPDTRSLTIQADYPITITPVH